VNLEVANEDRWRDRLRRSLAKDLGISAWRVLIDYVRAGSVNVGVRIIDTEEMGTEPTAADSANYLINYLQERFDAERAIDLPSLKWIEIVAVGASVRMPSPPPPPPPSAPPPPSPPPAPDPCDASDAAVFFNTSLGWDDCRQWSSLWTLRLTVLAGACGSVIIALVLVLVWFCGLNKTEQFEVQNPFRMKEAAAQRQRSAEMRRQRRMSGVRLPVSEKAKRLKRKVKHPLFGFWRSTMAGLVDILTDLLFCLSLVYESQRAAERLRADNDEEEAARVLGIYTPLFVASAACIAISVLFNFTAVLRLYFSHSKDGTDYLARTVFSVDAKGVHKARRRRRRRRRRRAHRRARRRRPSKG